MRNDWHIDKTVSIGHMISTVVVLVTGVMYIDSIDTKVEKQGVKIEAIQQQVQQQRSDTKDMFLHIREDMKRINDKLDRLIEK
jgi:hypothetical protein